MTPTEEQLLQETEAAVNPIDSMFDDYFAEQEKQLKDFSASRLHLTRIVDDWNEEIRLTEERRKTRDIEINVDALRKAKKLDEDETIVPDRIIDSNIQREQPPYINYLKNSRRLAIFTCTSNPDLTNTQRLELDFTRGMTYLGWETPHFKCLDGAQTHGWDAIEVVYDRSKPLKVALEQIGHERLLFPKTCLDIQDAATVIRVYNVTISQLQKFVVKNGFSKEQVGKLIAARKNTEQVEETITIYKKYCKYDGRVYVAWFSLEQGCDDWLKTPIPLFLGMRHQEEQLVEVPVTQLNPMTGAAEQIMTQQPQVQWVDTPIVEYPIYILPYRETEKPQIMDRKGRVFLDYYKQEAMTAILSSFINGLYRATQVYASRGQEDGTGSSLEEEGNIVLTGNRILNKPVNFFHTDYPDPMVLKALQYFDAANAAETNQVTYAVNNRQDSRKTAKEISSAEQKEALLNSVQLTLFSTHIRSIYNLVWLIVQSLALQDEIKFLMVAQQKPQINPLTGQPIIDEATQQPIVDTIYVNDFETIKQVYDVRAAGDVDVVQKQEKVMQMKQDWPVVSATVLRDVFLAELMRLQYPDTGEKWAKILETQGSMFAQMTSLLGGLAQMLTGAMQDNPEMLLKLPPQQQAAMQQMIQQATQLSAAGQQAVATQNQTTA